MSTHTTRVPERPEGLRRTLGLFDSTMLVAGSMIGTGIFIVAAEMARNVGSPGALVVAWLITGLLTVAAALAYGELAAMIPTRAVNTSTSAKRGHRSADSCTGGRSSW